MPPSPSLRPLWLLVALLLGACATSGQREDALNRTLRQYEKAVRWVQFDAVYAYHRWSEGGQPAPPAALRNVRVTRYHVNNSQLSDDALHYHQTVTIHYYLLDSPRERSIVQRQQWEYDPGQKRWLQTGPPPAFLRP